MYCSGSVPHWEPVLVTRCRALPTAMESTLLFGLQENCFHQLELYAYANTYKQCQACIYFRMLTVATNLCVCECVEPHTEKIRVGQCFDYARAGLVGGLSRIAYLCFRI